MPISLLNELFAQLAGGALVVAVISFVFWKADDLISKSGKELLAKLIGQSINDPERSELRQALMTFLKQYFSTRLPVLTFIGNVALLTAASITILLIIYITRTDKLLEQLSSDSDALRFLLTQVIFNGFIVTYVVNHVAFSLYSELIDRFDIGPPRWSVAVILADALLKMLLFIGATIASYVLYAHFFGSFGGSAALAAHAAIPTVANGLRFENLTGVYLYSVAISSLPIFLISLINLLIVSRRTARLVQGLFFWLPFEGHPMRFIAVVLAIFAIIFYQVSSAVLTLM